MLIAAFDPGITNIGFVALQYNTSEHNCDNVQSFMEQSHLVCFMTISWIDLTKKCKTNDCLLGHSCEMVDGYHHLKQMTNILDNCDIILIERQLPTGYTALQNILLHDYAKQKNKVMLIAPNSRNKFFHLHQCGSRFERKGRLCDIGSKWIPHVSTPMFYTPDVFNLQQTVVTPSTTTTMMKTNDKNELLLLFASLVQFNDSTSFPHLQPHDYNLSKTLTNLQVLEAHDRYDAFCLILFWLETTYLLSQKQKLLKQHESDIVVSKHIVPTNLSTFFSQFVYKPQKK